MSFSLSIARTLACAGLSPGFLVATTYEGAEDLPDAARSNAETLLGLGARVLHGIDATDLLPGFMARFDTIVFQFPNLGSRRSVWGSTANHHLIRRFLRSAGAMLAPAGLVAITTVDTPFYHGLFDIPRAAERAGHDLIQIHPFDPKAFDSYAHVDTLDLLSALRATHPKCTWVLKPA